MTRIIEVKQVTRRRLTILATILMLTIGLPVTGFGEAQSQAADQSIFPTVNFGRAYVKVMINQLLAQAQYFHSRIVATTPAEVAAARATIDDTYRMAKAELTRTPGVVVKQTDIRAIPAERAGQWFNKIDIFENELAAAGSFEKLPPDDQQFWRDRFSARLGEGPIEVKIKILEELGTEEASEAAKRARSLLARNLERIRKLEAFAGGKAGGGLKGSAIGLLLFGIPGFDEACSDSVSIVCSQFAPIASIGPMSLCAEISTKGCEAIANASGVEQDSILRTGTQGLLTGLWNVQKDIESGNYHDDVDRGGEDGAEGASGYVGDFGPGEPGEADISFGADDGTGSGDEADGGNTANGSGSDPANGREPDGGTSNESGGSGGSSDSSSGGSDQAEGPLYDFFCWLFGCDSDKKKSSSSGSTRESDPPDPPEPPDDPCVGAAVCVTQTVDNYCPADAENCRFNPGRSSGNELVDRLASSSPAQKGHIQQFDVCSKVSPDESGLCDNAPDRPHEEAPAGGSPIIGEGVWCGDPKATPDPDQDNCGSSSGGIEYIGPSTQKPSNIDCDQAPDPEIGGCGQPKGAVERDPIGPLVQ